MKKRLFFFYINVFLDVESESGIRFMRSDLVSEP